MNHAKGNISHEEVLTANKQYYNNVAKDYFTNEFYAYSPNIVNNVLQNIQSILQKIGQRGENRRFLDIGCGSGFLTDLVLRSDPNSTIYGIDISEKQIELYANRFPQSHCDVGDITKLNYQDKFFDFVACYSVLHHVLNYQDVIKEVARVVRENGYFYCDFEPNRRFKKMASGIIRLRKKIFDKAPQELDNLEQLAEYHNNYEPGIDIDELVLELQSEGFEVITVGRRFPDMFSGRILKALSIFGWNFVPSFYVIARKVKGF